MIVVALLAQLLQGRPPRVDRRIVPVSGTRGSERRDRGPGGEAALGYRLEPDLERDVSPGRYPDKLQAQAVRRGNGPRLGKRGPRLTAKLAHVEDKRAPGCVCTCAGHDSVLVRANGNRAHSLPAARGIPNLAHRAGIPARPYSSALLFG